MKLKSVPKGTPNSFSLKALPKGYKGNFATFKFTKPKPYIKSNKNVATNATLRKLTKKIIYS